MSYFKLIIDKRERNIINILNQSQLFYDSKKNIIEWEIKHLTIGDYIIFYKNQAIIVIERKTWTDLAASFRDGRKENIHKLQQYREQTGAKIAYLIEGKAFPSKHTKFSRIPYCNLRAHLDHLIFRDNIIELRSSNHRGTVERIFEFIKNLSTLNMTDLHPIENIPTKKNTTEKNTTKNIIGLNSLIKNNNTEEVIEHLNMAQTIFHSSNDEITERIWCCIPGISNGNVYLFLNYHISDLLLGNIPIDEIANLSYQNGRKLGNKKAYNIFNITKLENKLNQPYYLKILSTIPNISRNTAKKILEIISMKEIMINWNIIRQQLIELSRGKTKLGEKSVNLIEKFLHKIN
jgi:ERCC4-type nuclease